MPRTGNRGSGGSGGPESKLNMSSGKHAASRRRTLQDKKAERAVPRNKQQAEVQASTASGAHTLSGDHNSLKLSASETAPQRAFSKLNSLMRSSEYDPRRAESEHQGWKSAVHRYVSLYNQAETNQHAAVLTDYVSDGDHCERLRFRLERLRERDLLRGALPAGCETRAELVRVNESSAEVAVLIRLHVKRRMEQSMQHYLEERSEYERLWLSRSKGSWTVHRVEPIIAERRPRFGGASDSWITVDDYAELFGEISSPSTPYLNYDLLPQFKHRAPGIRYRRDLAAAYADRWWNEGNPAYELFEVNCTHYVSQCIFAGNAPMNYTGKRAAGWWYKGRSKGGEWWSFSWAVSNALTNYLTASRSSGLRAKVVQSADELQLGDVITYDWNGDNRFQHSTIVTAFDSFGMPLVNANTVSSRHRYWDYRDSYAWTEQTKYRFFHIHDLL